MPICPTCHQSFECRTALSSHLRNGACKADHRAAVQDVDTSVLEINASIIRSDIMLSQAHWRYEAGMSHSNVTMVALC